MDFFVFLFLALVVAAASVFLVVMFYIGRIVRMVRKYMRGEMSDEEFQRKSNKYYYQQQERQGPQFDKDYFKGSSNQSQQNYQEQARQHKTYTTRTEEGHTIFDQRENTSKKIFAQDEGEYVDFVEE
ncbi:MAG: DUF4834 family protein [Prevotella sp.]|nr:DUF4834 family protein [Prevotella sp.]